MPGVTLIMLERAGVTLVGEHVRHIAVGRVATAEISAVGFQREDIDINILSPSKVPVLYRWVASVCLSAQPGLNPPNHTIRVGSHLAVSQSSSSSPIFVIPMLHV